MIKLLIVSTIIGIMGKKKEQMLISTIITNIISIIMIIKYNNNNIEEQYRDTIKIRNIIINMGIDGINIILIIMTTIIYPIIITYTESKKERRKLIILEGIILIILSSTDIGIFYIIYEIILIPFFIQISQYGSRGRMEASKRIYIYSLIGSIIILITIIGIIINMGSTSNEIITIKISEITNKTIRILIWVSIFIPLGIKIPIYPLHSWLPLAHTEANTIGSVILAGIILKIGTYGIYRYIVELFKINNIYYTVIIGIISIITIIYGSIITLRQIDIKRIIAYTSIIHMNYTTIGIIIMEYISIIGSTYIMISHSIISSGWFITIGGIYKRYKTRIIKNYKEINKYMPIYGTIILIWVLNMISIPLTSSFIGEIITLTGIYNSNIIISILISISIIINTIYTIWLYVRITTGKTRITKYKDISIKEIITITPLIIYSIILGIKPNILVEIITISILRII